LRERSNHAAIEVSFASIVGLFCLYSRSLLPERSNHVAIKVELEQNIFWIECVLYRSAIEGELERALSLLISYVTNNFLGKQ